MNVFICDPDIVHHEHLRTMIMTWGKTHRHEKDLFVQSFGSSNELIDAWEKSLNMDILFIASAFPGDVSGFETAYRIQREQSGIPIILMMKDKRVYL
ncbi:MAG: hypothetical protein IJI21_09860 [Clostridia bacterium]|nr:hypothetical protein [Clostridia bacterium]